MTDAADEWFTESPDDVWSARWPPGWVAEVAGALTRVTDRFRSEPPTLIDSTGTPIDHRILVQVVTESAEAVLEGTRAVTLTTQDLAEFGGAAANLAVVCDPGSAEMAATDDTGLVSARDVFRRLAANVWSAVDSQVRRLPDGSYRLHWRAADAEMIRQLGARLDGILESDDPTIARLFPPAYGTDNERSVGFDALARYELIDRRRASLGQLSAAVDDPVVDAEQLASVMRAVNDLRLMVGTHLDVSEDEPLRLSSRGNDAAMVMAYERLSQLLVRIVDALADD